MNGGSGYRTAPTVTFIGGGGGSGAAETRLVRRGYDSLTAGALIYKYSPRSRRQ